MEEHSIYSLQISTALLRQLDQVAEILSKESELFPSGKCKRADVARLCLVRGLGGLSEEFSIKLKK